MWVHCRVGQFRRLGLPCQRQRPENKCQNAIHLVNTGPVYSVIICRIYHANIVVESRPPKTHPSLINSGVTAPKLEHQISKSFRGIIVTVNAYNGVEFLPIRLRMQIH